MTKNKVNINKTESEEARIRRLAEDHWKYTEEVARQMLKLYNASPNEVVLELCKFFYIEAMIHGIKHGREGRF